VSKLGIVLHHHRPEVRDIAHQVLKWCADQTLDDIAVGLPEADARLIGRPELAEDEAVFGRDLDVCVSLGGDGTMLRAAALVALDGVPILGVNAGRLGYLAEVEPGHLTEILEMWSTGRLREQPRMMIEITSDADTGDGTPFKELALNEAVVARVDSGHTVDVLATIKGRPFTNYLADAVILATPTGSTAYSLSAGGPIVEPDFRALILTPVAAHMVFNRSMILAPTTEVTLTVQGHRGAVLSIDGRTSLELAPGQAVHCRAAEIEVKLLVTGERDFHTVLKEKFHLIDWR
jgi:NAD+ kinase